MMALFYYIVDVRGWQKWTLVFRVVGMTYITIYLAQRLISFSTTNKFLFSGLAGLFPENIQPVIMDTGYIVVCWLFLYFLYKKKTFLKV
jgi:predicted acyltransferase